VDDGVGLRNRPGGSARGAGPDRPGDQGAGGGRVMLVRRGRGVLLILLAGLMLPACAGAQATVATLEGATEDLRTGNHEDAIEAFAALAAAPDAPAAARRGLVRSLLAVGRLGEALDAGERGESAV